LAVRPNPTNTEESGDKGAKAKKRKTKKATKPVTQSPRRQEPKKTLLPSSDSEETINEIFAEDDGQRNGRGRKRRH
jgi:hypothetical protein